MQCILRVAVVLSGTSQANACSSSAFWKPSLLNGMLMHDLTTLFGLHLTRDLIDLYHTAYCISVWSLYSWVARCGNDISASMGGSMTGTSGSTGHIATANAIMPSPQQVCNFYPVLPGSGNGLGLQSHYEKLGATRLVWWFLLDIHLRNVMCQGFSALAYADLRRFRPSWAQDVQAAALLRTAKPLKMRWLDGTTIKPWNGKQSGRYLQAVQTKQRGPGSWVLSGLRHYGLKLFAKELWEALRLVLPVSWLAFESQAWLLTN